MKVKSSFMVVVSFFPQMRLVMKAGLKAGLQLGRDGLGFTCNSNDKTVL